MPARTVPTRRRRAAALGLGLLAVVATADHAEARRTGREDFHLVDSAGRAYSLESFPAHSLLVIYFGYTTCLQACPTALDSIAGAIDDLGTEAASVRPVFIDMDPARAAELSLPLFMQSFGPSFLGLTGSAEAVKQAAGTFDVQVQRLQFSADPSDYTMTHTSPIFVMRPDDPHPSSLPATSSPDEIAAALRRFLKPAPAIASQ